MPNSVFRPFLTKYAMKHVPVYVLGLAALIATTVVTVRIPKVIGELIDQLRLSAHPESAMPWVWQLVILAALLALFRTLSRVLIFYPGRKVEQSVRQDFFNSLTLLPAQEQSRFTVGDVMSRGVNDVTAVRVMLSMGILHIVNTGVLGAGALQGMWSLSPELTQWLLIPVLAMFATTAISVRFIYKYIRSAQERLGALSEMVRESLGAYELVNTYAIRQALIDRFETVNRSYSQAVQVAAAVRSLIFPIMSVFMGMGIVMVLWFGGNRVIDGTLKLGALVAFMTYLGILLDPVVAIGWVVNALQRGHSALVRLFALIELSDAQQLHQPHADWPGKKLEIRNLHYTYPYTTETEDQSPFSLQIDQLSLSSGQSLGVFGATGSGKTTLAHLLAGVIPAPEKSIYLDDQDQAHIEANRWKSAISYVPQQSFLFSASIAENICMSQDQDAKRLAQAIQFSALSDDIAGFPQGLKTRVGEGGISLSGGQRQRVSLARAMYHRGQMFVLDDTTAAVDLLTESKILNSIQTKLKDTLLIISSHRVNTLTFCDLIVILDEGKVVDQGTHAELLKRNKLYHATWEYERRLQDYQVKPHAS